MSGSYATTPNFALKKPVTGADDDLWGTHWNQNADTLDATLKAHGDAISGLGAGGVTSWNTRVGAVTLTNADVTAVLPPSSTTPTMDGTAAIGVGTTWARSDHIHPTDTSRASVASVPVASGTAPIMDGTAVPGTATAWARGDHVHPTDTSRYAASNPSGYQTAAQVAAVTPGFNYTDNSGFSLNQRGYVSGTALAAGIYGFDRWKAGAAGCTLTFTASPPATTVTITAGTLQQVIEGASVVGGNYMLSWTGTAQGRVGAGAYAASPVAVAGIAAGANTTIEFNAGTLGRVKLEPGTTATPWVAGPAQQELAKCQRFYSSGQVIAAGYCSAGFLFAAPYSLPVPMRATPTIAITSFANCINLTGVAVTAGAGTSVRDLYGQGTASASAATTLNLSFNVSADL